MSDAGALPSLMVAPNGARRGKADHPALPEIVDEIAATARACERAGADGIHLHVRDADGRHSLDTGLYREACAAVAEAAPGLFVQVTSEAAGRYSASEQRAMIEDLKPRSVSVALREMLRMPADKAAARAFYAWAAQSDIRIQHIVYAPEELHWLLQEIESGTIPGTAHQLQFVLGRYDSADPPAPGLLDAYLAELAPYAGDMTFDWMVCAFGPSETDCLTDAVVKGGKARVGFENSFWNADGSVAKDNAERVAEVRAAIAALSATRAPQTVSPSDR